MIKSLTITNHLGDSIVLELARPEKSGFVVKNIDGLGPVKANINMSTSATCDGSMFNSAFMDTRDINLSLLYYQTDFETIEDIRQKSYKYFPNKKKIRILVETENRNVWTEGYVEDNTPNIFSPDSGCTITIRCPDPYLYSVTEANTLFHGVSPEFEFPFVNEPVDEQALSFGTIIRNTEGVVFYEGDCDIGCTITIDVIGSISGITIRGSNTHEQMVIDGSKIKGFVDGDTIVIETSIGQKGIMLIRDGNDQNILNCLSRDSTWFTLSKGNNRFSYSAANASDDAHVRFRISNKIIYYGV